MGLAFVFVPVQPCLFVFDLAACPITEAEIPAPVYKDVRRDCLMSDASFLTLSVRVAGRSWYSDAVSQLGQS